MEIICEKDQLVKGLQKVQTITTNRSSLPILANVLLEAEKTGIKLSATDLEVGLKSFIPADVKKTGATTLPAKKLYEIVRVLPEKNVSIKIDSENRCTIQSGKSVFKIMGLAKEEFPVLPEFKEANLFKIEKTIFLEMIRKTIFSVSQDETRYVLCGIFLDISGGEIKMVSTDGRRLSYIHKKIKTETDKDVKIVIPSKAIHEVIKILNTEVAEEVEIDIEENQIVFKCGETVLISRLIEGKYPNYEQVIPEKNQIQVRLKKESFMNATSRVALMTSDKTNSIRYDFKNKQLIISSEHQGFGEAQEDIDIDYAGNELRVAYNPMFLLDVLKNIDDEDIYLELTDSLKPGVIKPTQSNDYLSVIMPMRT